MNNKVLFMLGSVAPLGIVFIVVSKLLGLSDNTVTALGVVGLTVQFISFVMMVFEDRYKVTK